MKAVLQFKDYHVVKSIYHYNPFMEDKEERLSPNFKFSIEFTDDSKNEAWITLEIELGDKLLQETSFYVCASIMGLFEIRSKDVLSEETKLSYYKVNAVAILYPYLRSLISDLTGKGSESPIILPTMNIVEMMKKQEREKKEEARD